MSLLAIDNYLGIIINPKVVFLLNLLLKSQNHRARCIYQFYIILFCNLISAGWLTMCPEQHTYILQLLKLFMINGYKSHLLKPLHLNVVVNNVTQTVKCTVFLQLFFRFVYCFHNSKTESGTFVYFNFAHYYL